MDILLKYIYTFNSNIKGPLYFDDLSIWERLNINKLESKADVVFDKAVADIFENESDAKNIIKYKEVLSALESASDKCKSVSNVMEQISVKHS